MAGPEHQTPKPRTPYPLLHLDMSLTNTTNGDPNYPPSAVFGASGGPGDKSRYPPSADEARDSYRAKRPAGSPISNTEKRARVNGSADQGRSNATSPATSRQNSITATVGPSPARRPSAMSSVDASRDPRRQGTGHAGLVSPMHAASSPPMANGDAGQQGSGNTTPVDGAPPAPSMVPPKSVPAMGGARGVASIRQTVLKKQTAPGVGSENVALALLRAKQIDLQRSVKTATEQIDAVQTEHGKATAQREQAERDLKTQLGHLQEKQEKQGKVSAQQEQAEMDLKAKLNQLQIELDTEKKQRLQMELRLQKVEMQQSESQNAPADTNLSKQVNDLVSKIQQLETLSKPDARAKQAAQDSAKIQSQIENSVKHSVQSDIKVHGDRITELEAKSTAIQTSLEKPKPKYEEIIKQLIGEEIIALSSRLSGLETEATSITSRVDALDLEKSESRLNTARQEEENLALSSRISTLECSAKIQSQIENSVKRSIQSDIKVHGDRITELEAKSTAIQTSLEKPKPKYEEIIKQLIGEEIIALSSRLSGLETEATSITSRVDALDMEKSKSRLNTAIQDLSNATQIHEHNLNELKDEVKLMGKKNDDWLQKLNQGMKTATSKSTANDKRIDALVKTDIKLLKEGIEALQKADLAQKISDLKSDLAVQKENSTRQFKKVESDLSKKSTVSQEESFKKQLDAVPEPIKSYVDMRVEQQMPLQINPIKTALEGLIIKSTHIIKRDIAKDVAKIRQEVEQNGSTLGERDSSTSASMQQLRKDMASDVSTAVEGLRSEISNLDLSSALSGVQIELEELKSANSSDIKRLRQDVDRLRTVSGPSANQDFATKGILEQLEGRLLKADKTAARALEEAINAANFTKDQICGAMDELSSQIGALESTVKALQDEVKPLHEQSSSRPDRIGPAHASLSSLSRDEGTNVLREDTHAENSAVEHRLEQMDLMLKSLTSRCDNITTDYLHQSMLQWFQQNYPNAPNFLGELQRMQGELRRIDGIANALAWLTTNPTYSQKLFSLTRDSGAIQQLLHDKNRPGSPATLEELDGIRNKVETEAQTRSKELEAVRAEVAAERSDREQLANSLMPIRNAFGTTLSKVENMATKVDNWESKIVKVDSARELLATSLLTLNEQSERLAKRMSTVECTTGEQGRSLVTHQQSIDDVKSTIEQHGQVQETHREFIKKLNANVATLMVSCYELQKFTRMINQNLKRGGFSKKEFDFSYSFEEPPKPQDTAQSR